jgi:hypothetical protein
MRPLRLRCPVRTAASIVDSDDGDRPHRSPMEVLDGGAKRALTAGNPDALPSTFVMRSPAMNRLALLRPPSNRISAEPHHGRMLRRPVGADSLHPPSGGMIVSPQAQPAIRTGTCGREPCAQPAFSSCGFSNGTFTDERFSSHAGTGRLLERRNSGLNSFD